MGGFSFLRQERVRLAYGSNTTPSKKNPYTQRVIKTKDAKEDTF